ncbi:von Willebrand factor A domain-containing protein 7-like [Mytilus californianus]|uniref:von Willebrand factor A domain-containing protein 7-like n=1 Tax=Mytilus californianus TaxID=6549 RepID=UPI002245D7EB|nr:von Willebrand factor A domain-containing protein 7-like [Mytilus californianus]
MGTLHIMKIRTIPHILLFIWTFTYTEAFFPNPYGQYVGKDDFTHAEITEIGILKAVAAFYEETPLTPGGSTPSSGSLTGIQDITAKKLYDKVYAGSRSPRRLQDAIDNIVSYNNKVDQDHHNVAAWHFNGEQIEQSNLKLQGIRTQLLSELHKHNPNYELSRQLIGQFLHILQMFYSNTNWIEENGANKYPAVGMTGVTLLPTAGSNDDACKSCSGVCVFNIILPKKQFLTSGYKSGQDIQKPYKDPKANTKGKCSHGGPTDNTTTTSAATGGINKDSKVPDRSPHFYKHTQAAQTAIDHTVYFFNDNTNGIRHLISKEKFMNLLQLDSSYSLVFVIDTSGSMVSDLPTIIQESKSIIQTASTVSNAPSNYILVTFSDPELFYGRTIRVSFMVEMSKPEG